MSRLVVFSVVALGVLAAAFVGCINPVYPRLDTSLAGDWVGFYSWTNDPHSVTTTQPVRVHFTDSRYDMRTDTTSALYNPDICFCRGYGTYSRTDVVTLTPTTGVPEADNCPTCDPSMSPDGVYSLSQDDWGIVLYCKVSENGQATISKFTLWRPTTD